MMNKFCHSSPPFPPVWIFSEGVMINMWQCHPSNSNSLCFHKQRFLNSFKVQADGEVGSGGRKLLFDQKDIEYSFSWQSCIPKMKVLRRYVLIVHDPAKE